MVIIILSLIINYNNTAIGINMDKREESTTMDIDKTSLFVGSGLPVIAKAGQSATVAGRLKENGFLNALVESVATSCTVQGNRKSYELVECAYRRRFMIMQLL